MLLCDKQIKELSVPEYIFEGTWITLLGRMVGFSVSQSVNPSIHLLNHCTLHYEKVGEVNTRSCPKGNT